ncbi:hypothetical protein EDC04DRAFT_2603075 [Pisolithus marmoratus]|nr:hypothetical protein EDC04DRAFT_2603075 [Pisolithus marmoratus]
MCFAFLTLFVGPLIAAVVSASSGLNDQGADASGIGYLGAVWACLDKLIYDVVSLSSQAAALAWLATGRLASAWSVSKIMFRLLYAVLTWTFLALVIAPLVWCQCINEDLMYNTNDKVENPNLETFDGGWLYRELSSLDSPND